ncbi:MAG: phosphatidylserine/phosphatidylglycerophosphate/cardiolipin synthase family protein [Myxococcales bacterium]|nr:phosphatidylserine/phosphatidylglycerophosphate/cardiolipin synthase family protein [Myxococcales bacterium]
MRAGVAEARIDRVDGLGRARPFTGVATRVVGGIAAEGVRVDAGRARWRDDGAAAVAWSLGDVAQVRTLSARLADEGRPIGLFDAADAAAPDDAVRRWWAVRLDADAPAAGLRAKHPACPVVDADTLLGDGHPDDLPDAARAVRLLRCARHLRAAGLGVDAVAPPAAALRTLGPVRGGDALVELAGARPDRARRVDLLFENGAARRALLDDIAAARRTLHLQTYIFEPDALGAAVADALRAAGARGVRVRVLVDALYSGHGALGRTNPVLEALATATGVEVRAARPVWGVPGLRDLKARDHRKLVVVDGRRAHVTGRNVGAAYYRGFDEVALGPDDGWQQVPWLDAGVALEGPVVRALGQCFVDAWRAAGGEARDAGPAGAGGEIPVRFVVHRSLEDANTLEVYRRLFDEAAREILVVNTFPLQFELRAALLRARARGVTVRVLVGNVRPLRGDGQPFRGGMIRDLATAVIHGRLDPLVQAGAEAVEHRVAAQPGWAAGVGAVRPHVHAKLVCVDGARLTVGSANLDITAGYWESEALVSIEHAPTVARAREVIDGWLRGGLRHDPGDPGWQARAARRGWIAQNWPSVLG